MLCIKVSGIPGCVYSPFQPANNALQDIVESNPSIVSITPTAAAAAADIGARDTDAGVSNNKYENKIQTRMQGLSLMTAYYSLQREPAGPAAVSLGVSALGIAGGMLTNVGPVRRLF